MHNQINILVGEDSSIIINLTKSVLAFENYSMKAARNGKQVLEILAAEDFDLILMDITMPQMDGIQCTKEIRKLADPKKIVSPSLRLQVMPPTILQKISGNLGLTTLSRNL